MTVGSEIQGAPQPESDRQVRGDRNPSAADVVGDARPPGSPRPIDTLATLARHLLAARGALAVEYQDDDETVRVISSVGETPIQLGEVIPTHGYLPRRVHPRGLLLIRDIKRHRSDDCDHVLPRRGIRAILGAPICGEKGPLGIMCVVDGDPRDWTESERETIRALARAASHEGLLPSPLPSAGDPSEAASLPGGLPAPPPTDPGTRGGTGRSPEYTALLSHFTDDPTPAVIATGRGEILRCNPGFARLLGFDTADAARGYELSRLFRIPEQFSDVLRRLERGEMLQSEALQLRRLDGEPVDAVATIAGVIDDRGRLGSIRARFTDSHAEGEPHRAHDFIELVETATQDVIWVWDLTEERLEWSNGGPRRFRYAPKEMRHGIDWHVQRVHPDDRDRVIRGIHAALQGLDTVWAGEYRFRRGDGSYAHVLDRAFIVRGERGEPLRVVGWMLDVSQWREAESAHQFLVEASRILESTLDLDDALRGIARATADFMGDYCRLDILDADGELKWMASHPRLEDDDLGRTIDFLRRISGRPEIEPLTTVLDRQETVLIPAARNRRGNRKGNGGDAADSGSAAIDPGQASERGQTNTSKEPARALLLVPITNRSGTVGLLTLARSAPSTFQPVDLIRARELARLTGLAVENCRLYQTAQQALTDREELLRFVSHDLRNPLHAIVSALGLAREGNGERLRWLEPIERAVDQMRQLVEDLLDTASIEAGNFTLRRSWHSPEKLATTACDVLRPMAEAKGIDLACTIDPGLPQVWIDFQQYLRVLSNLLVNALKFTGNGGKVHLHVGSAGSEMLISVADSGPGIPEDELETVFTRYWQGRRGDRRGAGLGLAIARAIVKAHGGRVWAESRSGQGATFFATIPIVDEPPTDASSDAYVRRRRGSG